MFKNPNRNLTAAMACLLALAACGTDTADATPENLVYGTATLTYAEFFSGDVSSTDSFDAVSSATTSKYEIMSNMDTDFVDETANADGYHITGVKNVNVAVSEADYEAYQACNPTFVPTEGEAPAQYKVVTMEDGAAVYSETHFNIADTVTDATAELVTGGTYGSIISSNTYADVTVALPISQGQKAALADLSGEAGTLLEELTELTSSGDEEASGERGGRH